MSRLTMITAQTLHITFCVIEGNANRSEIASFLNDVLLVMNKIQIYCTFSTLNPTSLTSCNGLSRMFCSNSKW